MKATCFHAVAVMVVLALAQMPALAQTDVGTAFTYQGQLKQNGVPVDPDADFVFELWDAETGGTRLGKQIRNNWPVFNGLFTVPLDFGVDPWTANEARWLEIAVDGTPLSPRQEVTPTPHALALPGLRTWQNDTCPNVLGGHSDNRFAPDPDHPLDVVGATISGGGSQGSSNQVQDHFATVGGGEGNLAGSGGNPDDGTHATVAGGSLQRGLQEIQHRRRRENEPRAPPLAVAPMT